MIMSDIDIDLGNRDDILKFIKHVPARMNTEGKKHNSGVYVQAIPFDHATGTSSIGYKEAEERGYFKLDFLNMKVYSMIRDPKHYDELNKQDIPWNRLSDKEFVSQLVHLGNYYDLLQTKQPKTIPQLAMFLAIIRPGKRHLGDLEWKEINKTVWDTSESEGYTFKKSHSIAYAALVALHMKILNETK